MELYTSFEVVSVWGYWSRLSVHAESETDRAPASSMWLIIEIFFMVEWS
jgi:hypothetical protein